MCVLSLLLYLPLLTASQRMFTSLPHNSADSDAVMKNPFYTLEMPINASGFDTRVAGIVGPRGEAT